MLKPSAEELKTAERLKIEGAADMTGPELRTAIQRERARLKALREGRKEYDRWAAMCRACLLYTSPSPRDS